MENSSRSNDIIASFKATPDAKQRLAVAVCGLGAFFLPIWNAYVSSSGAHPLIRLVPYSFLLPIFAVLVALVPVVAYLRANSRLIDMCNGALAIIIPLHALYALMNRPMSTPHWGVLFLAGYMYLAIKRGRKALQAERPTA